MLIKLYEDPRFTGFYMQPNGPKINHLAYSDDLIIFCAGKTNTLKLVMEYLKKYGDNSGQLINREQSYFLMGEGISSRRIEIV